MGQEGWRGSMVDDQYPLVKQCLSNLSEPQSPEDLLKCRLLGRCPWDSDSVGGHESEFLINSQLITQAEAASNSHALVGRPQLTDGH